MDLLPIDLVAKNFLSYFTSPTVIASTAVGILSTIIGYQLKPSLMNHIYLYTTILLLFFTTTFIAYYGFNVFQVSRRLLPGIPVLPPDSLFGFSAPFIPKGNGHRVMLDYAEKYGIEPGLSQFKFLGSHFVNVYDSRNAKRVLRDVTGKGFFHREKQSSGFFRRSMFGLDTGPEWQMRRSCFRHAFSPTNLKLYHETIQNVVSDLCIKLQQLAEMEEIVEIDTLFGQMTVDIICEVAFQYKIDALKDSEAYEDIANTIQEYFKMATWVPMMPFASFFISYFPFGVYHRFKKVAQKLDEFEEKIYAHILMLNHNEELNEKGLAKALMDFGNMPGIVKEDVKAEIRTMFIAGHETTAHTLSFIVYALCCNQEIQHRAQIAIDEWTKAKRTSPSSSSPEDKSSSAIYLPEYVEAVVKEAMRRYPTAAGGSMRVLRHEGPYPITIERKFHVNNIVMKATNDNEYDENSSTTNEEMKNECNSPTSENGNGQAGSTETVQKHTYMIPQGSWLIVNIFALQNSSINWKNPLNFDPTRWMNKSNGNGEQSNGEQSNPLASLSAYSGCGQNTDELSFAPFSYGLRNCIGMNLALAEINACVSALLQKFNFHLACEDLYDETQAMELYLTLRPVKKLPVIVTKR